MLDEREQQARKSIAKMSSMIRLRSEGKGPLSSHTDARLPGKSGVIFPTDFIIRDAMTQDLVAIGFVASPEEDKAAQLRRLQPLLDFVKDKPFGQCPDLLVFTNLDLQELGSPANTNIKMIKLPRVY